MDQARQLSLLCQMANSESLQQLADLTYTLLGNPLFIADMAHTILAYTKTVNIPHPTWQRNVVHADLDKNLLRQDREVSSVHVASEESRRPVLVEDGEVPFPRLIKVLVAAGRPIGVMVLTAYLQPLGPQDIELMELVSSFVSSRLEKGAYYISSDNRSIENYLIKLVGGAPVSREEVEKRLNVLGCTCLSNLYVLSISTAPGLQDIHGNLSPILEAFSVLPFCHTFLYNSTLICIYSSDTEILHWEEQAPKLTALLSQYRLVAGVSQRFTGLEQLRTFYLQAHKALRLGCPLGRDGLYFLYDTHSVFHLFQTFPDGVPRQFCHQKIRELDEYDHQHNTELCITLQVYLEHNKSLSRTAEILFIHRNTVRYRINKCMELLGNNLDDGTVGFAYILSLRILEYERKLAPLSSAF